MATALIVGALLVRLSGTAPQARLRTAIITALTVAALLAAPSALRSFIQRTLESESAEGGWRLLLLWLAILSLVFFAAAAPRIGAPAAGITTVCAAIGGIIIGAAGQTFFDQLLIVNDSHEVVVHFAAVLALLAVLPLVWLVAAPMAWLWHSNQVD